MRVLSLQATHLASHGFYALKSVRPTGELHIEYAWESLASYDRQLLYSWWWDRSSTVIVSSYTYLGEQVSIDYAGGVFEG